MKRIIVSCLLLVLVGCGSFKLQGNGEVFLEYGTKIAIGHHTEKADETQVSESSADWDSGPLAWVFEWLLNPAEETDTDAGGTGN